ncbi:MAG: NADH-quinone oxidoreductase subunit C [Elusimicrobiota bacterium]
MFTVDVAQKVCSKFPDAVIPPIAEKAIRDPEVVVKVTPETLFSICKYLKEDTSLNFDLPIQMTSVDFIKEGLFELIYYLYSTKNKKGIVLKTQIPRDKAEVDSVSSLWTGMNWQEREVFDLMGITFKGHPYLKRIMMWEGFPGYPLRKDYVHITDKFDSGLEIGTPGLDEKGVPLKLKESHGV